MAYLSPVVWALNALSYLNGSAHRSVRRQSFAGTQSRAELERVARYYLTESPAVQAPSSTRSPSTTCSVGSAVT